MLKTRNRIILILTLLIASSCDLINVHDWPEVAENEESVVLRLVYDTDMTEWDHTCDGSTVTEDSLGGTYDNILESGIIRYVVRAYPTSELTSEEPQYTSQFEFTKNISDGGYDNEVTVSLLPGDYTFMVWSDLVESSSDDWFYDESDFQRITFSSDYHYGNNDYRDAFRGDGAITLEASVEEHAPDTLAINMERPLAKFEFVTTDLTEFITKEQLRLEEKARNEASEASETGDTKTTETKVNVEDYRVVFYYINFMPDTYNIFTDKPVNSSTGVTFESTLDRLSSTEASVGFDYVFVNGTESYVVLQIGLYDNEGTKLSLTNNITVPLKRSRHTVITGQFITSEASGGVNINTEYDGEYNIPVS